MKIAGEYVRKGGTDPETLHDWMLAQRELVPNGSATAKALDYSLKRWVALTRYLEDGAVPIDNNQVENQIRHGRSGARTGCLPGRYAAANGRRRS
jgi:hypothetical protein